MSVQVAEGIGGASYNGSKQIMVIDSNGPVTVAVRNLGKVSNVIPGFSRVDPNTGKTLQVTNDRETKRTAEATGFTGNGSTLAFTGQALNNLPITPGSVSMHPATAGEDLHDDGNGFLLLPDGTKVGRVDYFNGSISLNYPAGKAPTGAIAASYSSQDELIVPGGVRNYLVAALLGSPVRVYAAADHSDGAEVKVEAITTR